MEGAVTDEQQTFVEEWEHVSPGVHWILRLDRRGDEKPEAIQGSRVFKVTTYERMLTEDRVVDPKHNPFRNGSFRPVTVPGEISIEENPNALSEADIRRIFLSSTMAWEGYFELIDSPATLRRMLDVSEAMIDEGEDVSAKRLRDVRHKLSEVAPSRQLTQRDRSEYETIDKPGGSERTRRR